MTGVGKACHGVGGHCFGTAPSCRLCFPILQDARNSLSPSTAAPCRPPPCVYIRYKPSTKAAVLGRGGGGSLPRGVRREGAALFVTVFFVLSQLGRHGIGDGLIHSVQYSLPPVPQIANLGLPCLHRGGGATEGVPPLSREQQGSVPQLKWRVLIFPNPF